MTKTTTWPDGRVEKIEGTPEEIRAYEGLLSVAPYRIPEVAPLWPTWPYTPTWTVTRTGVSSDIRMDAQ